MFNTTDVRLLGTTFTITDSDGNPIRTMQVISALEITDAALGHFDDSFANYEEYLAQSIECLSGFASNPYRVLWWNCEGASEFANSDRELNIPRAVEHALKYGYDAIIVEDVLPLNEYLTKL